MSIADQFKPAGEGAQVRDLDLDLSAIKLDQSAQPREALNNDRIAEYAEAMKADDQFPPLTVFHDGSTYWLADGFHRHYAAQHAGRKHIRCYVRQGGLREAILWSVGANAKHGLARSDEDKKRAVIRLLEDAEWSTWTDRDIAKRCRVSHPFVAKVRKAHAGDTGNVSSMERTYVHPKTGKPTTMNTAGINAGRTQFQAKASEDNGSITGGAGAVTGEASRLASGRTDAGEEASVDLPTISHAERDADAIERAWKHGFLIGFGCSAEGYNAEYPFDGDVESDPDWLKSRDLAFAANRSAIINSPSDGDAFSEVKGTARLENANSVEPSPLDAVSPSDASAPVAVAEEPQAPRPTATANIPDPQASSSRQADKGDGAPPPASSPAHRWSRLRPHCLNPELCAGVGAKHCHACEKAMAEGEAA